MKYLMEVSTRLYTAAPLPPLPLPSFSSKVIHTAMQIGLVQGSHLRER